MFFYVGFNFNIMYKTYLLFICIIYFSKPQISIQISAHLNSEAYGVIYFQNESLSSDTLKNGYPYNNYLAPPRIQTHFREYHFSFDRHLF